MSFRVFEKNFKISFAAPKFMLVASLRFVSLEHFKATSSLDFDSSKFIYKQASA